MTFQPKCQEGAQTNHGPRASHAYVLPTVRCTSLSTAHPSSEAWPEPTPVAPPRMRRHLRPVAGPRTGAPAGRAGAVTGEERTFVVVPSRTFNGWHEHAAETQAYEERLLCSLLELRDPRLRMLYVTSNPVNPAIVEYYLSLLPRRLRRSARARLTLVGLGDRSARPLSEKLLERRGVLERIRSSLSGTTSAQLIPYMTTELERTVADELGIPMLGPDPGLSYLGTKSGCRALFASVGVPHPAGMEGLTSIEAVIDAIARLRAVTHGLRRVVVKLNNGVSGQGNALVDLERLPAPGSAEEAQHLAHRVARLSPEAPGITPEVFLSAFATAGGVVEEWIEAVEIRSPSAQLDIAPTGEVTLVSTHDQILGGSSGQSYLGCRFPAEPSYAPAIGRLAMRIGDRLAELGATGRCAIDFVVARDGCGTWRPYAIELNLRKGGTTHPYATLAHLTGGQYDPDSATFVTPSGERRHYVATDHLELEELRGLGCGGVLSLTRGTSLSFDRMRRCGPVFHMLSSIDELGRAGFTAIADSAASADAMYHSVQRTLCEHADRVVRRDVEHRPAARVSAVVA